MKPLVQLIFLSLYVLSIVYTKDVSFPEILFKFSLFLSIHKFRKPKEIKPSN